ncbi:FaeA/PapI family transcriptional regulator [Escherichia coli]|uniref:FaeA/PapI family transcriptional regulator n=1 Tax=Escherichia coli TaxID=562 RepID=UPI0010E38F78|nr:FaeA/PapI family transcriptional regulator [Escherichia coli]GDO98335.1 pap operon regulatory protein PapI [Escherichia coli]
MRTIITEYPLITEYLSQHKTATTAEVADLLKSTDYHARYVLHKLMTEGVVKRSPIRRGAKTLWEKVPAPETDVPETKPLRGKC